jgi:hypothetical protein
VNSSIRRFNGSRGDSPINCFIAKNGKGPYSDMSEPVSCLGRYFSDLAYSL